MAYQVPTCEPREVTPGDTWAWDVSYPYFPASEGWQLSYAIRGPDDLDVAWSTHISANGDVFEVRVPASTTDDVSIAGAYRMVGRVTLSGEVHVVYNQPLLVLANPTTAVNAKSFNRRMLEAIQAAALTDAAATGGALVEVTVDGHTHRFATEVERRTLVANYALLVAIEENPHGSLTHAAEFVRG